MSKDYEYKYVDIERATFNCSELEHMRAKESVDDSFIFLLKFFTYKIKIRLPILRFVFLVLYR